MHARWLDFAMRGLCTVGDALHCRRGGAFERVEKPLFFGVPSDQNGSQGQRKGMKKWKSQTSERKHARSSSYCILSIWCLSSLYLQGHRAKLTLTRQRLARARRAIHAIKILEPSSLSKYFGGRILFCDVEVSAQGHVRDSARLAYT